MPKKHPTPKALYTERARKLRQLGFNIAYKGNKKTSPQQKAAVNRVWFKNAFFYATNPDKNRLEFRPYSQTNPRSKWKNYVSRNQLYPKGVFIQRPKGVKKGAWKYTLKKDGSVSVTTKDGRVNDVILRLDMVEIARDPKRTLIKTLRGRRRPRQLLLTVNGFDAGKHPFEDLEQFNRYLENEFIPHLKDAEFDFDRWGQEIFSIHLVYSGKGQQKVKGEGKVYDFDKGGIFDASSKRVYGVKKFRDRKKWSIKKGKRKGT